MLSVEISDVWGKQSTPASFYHGFTGKVHLNRGNIYIPRYTKIVRYFTPA
jgi:hypothetical protein